MGRPVSGMEWSIIKKKKEVTLRKIFNEREKV